MRRCGTAPNECFTVALLHLVRSKSFKNRYEDPSTVLRFEPGRKVATSTGVNESKTTSSSSTILAFII